jgi:DNA-directed RNA polymerase specialized sigma24 family protein
VEGYRHAEIIRLKDGSVGTSKSQLHRARVMLRKLLSEQRGKALQAAASATQ